MIEKALMFKELNNNFTIVGGTYHEVCEEPAYDELFGSGLRAAIALSVLMPGLSFKTCAAEEDLDQLLAICSENQITPTVTAITSTITFSYLHPLKKPVMYPELGHNGSFELGAINGTNVLYYGMVEANIPVAADRLVYDPQSLVRFSETKSVATHLAVILNMKEARYFCGEPEDQKIEELGAHLRAIDNAEVVVIKNGSCGAWVFDGNGAFHIPIFQTPSVWPIGSGDIFSAVFGWQWMHLGKTAKESAMLASKFTASYCSTRSLPLTSIPLKFPALKYHSGNKQIYLAGPFFTQAERWLIFELKEALEEFGNEVFSPYHEVGIGSGKEIAKADLEGLNNCHSVLAVVSGLDPGTIFEIGYAIAKRKKVVAFVENVRDEDLLMLKGTGCLITSDFSTAVYAVSW